MRRKEIGDHLLPWQAAHLHQLRVHFITRHFTALPPIFDHKQRANFDLTWNSTKKGHPCSSRSSQSLFQNGQSNLSLHKTFPHQKGHLEHFVAFQEKWQVRVLGKRSEIAEQEKAKPILQHPSWAQEKSSQPSSPSPKCQTNQQPNVKTLGTTKHDEQRSFLRLKMKHSTEGGGDRGCKHH